MHNYRGINIPRTPWCGDNRVEFHKVSPAWVALAMHGFQAAVFDVRVDLCGADTGVSQHLLERADVSAAGQQVRGKTVPQRMWADIPTACPTGITTDQRPDGFPGNAATAARKKQPAVIPAKTLNQILTFPCQPLADRLHGNRIQ